MSELSPQAQAVLNAVVDGAHPAFAPIAAPMAAAALRAAALYCPRERRILMTIADELDS